MCIVKLDRDFNILWNRSIYSSGYTIGKYIIGTNDGYIILGAIQPYKGTFMQGAAISLSVNGNIQWKTLSNFGYNKGRSILIYGIETQSNAIIASGYGGHNYAVLTKINKNGKIEWKKSFSIEGSNSAIYSILEVSKGRYIVPVFIDNFSKEKSMLSIYMINEYGKTLWNKTIDLENCQIYRDDSKNLFIVASKDKITLFTYCSKGKTQLLMISLKRY